MKFTLTYEGELASNGRPIKKWEIRKHLDPQLKELWRISPALKRARMNAIIPKDGGSFFLIEQHHTLDHLDEIRLPANNQLDLCAPITRGNRKFLPIVRDSLALTCGLKIIFLRKETPGKVYQGGDMDNRLKTFFDALSIPPVEQMIDDPSDDDPIHCLLEDDRLITGFTIETHQLLSRPSVSEHYVQMMVEVDVRVEQARTHAASC